MLLKIICLGVLGSITALILKVTKPEFSKFLVIATGIVIIIIVVNSLSEVILTFNKIGNETKLDLGLFTGILKIIGIGYFTEYSASICEDLECKSIADKIQLAGKITIFLTSLPMITGLLNVVIKMLS